MSNPHYEQAVRFVMTRRDPKEESRIKAEIDSETAYLNQGDGKDEQRRLVVRLIGDIRGSDDYGGIGSRGAIRLCRAIEILMK